MVLLTLLFPALAFGETMDDLVMRDGLYYPKFSEVPFTRVTTGKIQGSFKYGKRDGPWVFYKEDGTVRDDYTGTYKDGVKISD